MTEAETQVNRIPFTMVQFHSPLQFQGLDFVHVVSLSHSHDFVSIGDISESCASSAMTSQNVCLEKGKLLYHS